MAQPSDLTQYQWKNRLVLLFAPSPEDTRYQEQKVVLEAARAGLEDRALVVFRLFVTSGYVGEKSLTQNEIASLRDRFEVAESAFVFILIGKDGMVKRRAEEVVSIVDLFDQIDAMPMRRREMNSP